LKLDLEFEAAPNKHHSSKEFNRSYIIADRRHTCIMSDLSVTSIDVVIPVHQPTSELRGTLRTLLEGTANQIILVCSETDTLSHWVETLPDDITTSSRLKVQWERPNQGPSYYRNAGIDASDADAVLFIDSDCEVSDGLVAAHQAAYNKYADTDATVGAVAGVTNLYPVTGSKTEESLLSSYYVGCFRKAERLEFVNWTPTSNLSVASKVLDDVRFDTSFPKVGGGEDIDICWQIRDAGYEIAGAGDAVVHHALWNPSREIFARMFRWGRAEYHLLKRHPERTRRSDSEYRRRLAEQASLDDIRDTCLQWAFTTFDLAGKNFETLLHGDLEELNTFLEDPDYEE